MSDVKRCVVAPVNGVRDGGDFRGVADDAHKGRGVPQGFDVGGARALAQRADHAGAGNEHLRPVLRLAEDAVGAHFQPLAAGVYYPLDTPLATRIFYILLPQNAYVPVAVRRFVDHALTWMGKAPAFDGKTA